MFARRIQKDHFVVYPFALEIQLDPKSRVLRLISLRVIEVA
jgi:hypothetical protein